VRVSTFSSLSSSKRINNDKQFPSVFLPTSQAHSLATSGAASSSSSLNAVPIEVLTSFLPPVMGFVKSEWIVSYGYGFATALSGLSILLKQTAMSQQPFTWTISSLQAAALVFYGFRLNAYLFIRNRLSPTYRAIGEKIEEKSKERFATRLSRAPFVLSCGLLYYGLYLPVLLTTKLSSDALAMKSAAGVGMATMKVLVGLQWFGYVLAALGDLTKSYVKGSEKNGKFLVTSGIFSVLRHPNFTGEILSWTANALCGTLAGAYLLRSRFSLPVLGYLGLSGMGGAGIIFVLLGATRNLEERQSREHGHTQKYKKWVKKTWCGWKMSPKPKVEEKEKAHEITMNADVAEDFGSGI